jgi:hypothetical protein
MAEQKRTQMDIRMIYLARRNPATTHEEFVSNWRQHIGLGGNYPSVYRRFTDVVQCDVILDLAIVDPAQTASAFDVPGGFDGIELTTARDLPASISVWDEPDVQNHLVPDERRVFSTIVQDLTLHALASVIIDGPRTACVLVRLLSRTPLLSREEFIRTWAALPLPTHESIRRHVRDFVILDPLPVVPFDGVEEIWFANRDDMAAYMTHDRLRDHVAREAAFVAGPPLALPTSVGIAFPPLNA